MYTQATIQVERVEYRCDRCTYKTQHEGDMKRHYSAHSLVTLQEGSTTFYFFEDLASFNIFANTGFLTASWDGPGWYTIMKCVLLPARTYQQHLQKRITEEQAILAAVCKFLDEHPVAVEASCTQS